jgi:glycosyltransferase involved in cell wall biosynthesis
VVHVGAEELTVHHFGPDPRQAGGIESVLRVLESHQMGADHVLVHPTQSRRGHAASLLSTARATRSLLSAAGSANAVAHAHLSQGASFVREGMVLAFAKRRGLATVATIHGSRFPAFADAHPRLVAGALRQVDLVTCLSEDVQDIVCRLSPRVSVTVMPNPVPADPSSPPADETQEIVLFAGEVGIRKGVDVLWRAWPIVAQRRPDANCIVIGPRTDLAVPSLERLQVLPVGEPADVRRLLRAARVVALPSRREGMPMILTEALSAGRPFVSTPVAGIPELANGTQPLVEVGDHTALADRLTELLADPALAKSLGERGRAFHRSTRSVEAVDAQLRTVYLDALRLRAGRSTR